MLITIIVFFAILFVLVIVHEWGHYIAAKKSGVHVEEFGFGLPPRIWGKKFGPDPKPGEEDLRTLWSINLLPIGGFVRPRGEDSSVFDVNDRKNLHNAPLLSRMIIVLAGPFMNLVLGILLFAVVYSIVGIPKNDGVFIKEVNPDTPAAEAGLAVGDKLVQVAGKDVATVLQVRMYTAENLGKNVKVRYMRGEEAKEAMILARENPPEGQGAFGVILDQRVQRLTYDWYLMPFMGVLQGFKDTYDLSSQIVPALGGMLQGIFIQREIPEGVGGPVQIAQAARAFCVIFEGDSVVGIEPISCMQFAALISINLAVFNLLPIPALDGGRFAFYLLEAVTRRRVSPRIEQWAHSLGFALLILLMIIVTVNDVMNPSELFK
jgi:regulator of sigma E protease